MSSDAVFIDASGWIALLSIDDWLHSYAVEHFQSFEQSNRRLITTDWVLAEAGNGLARPRTRHAFVSTVKNLFDSTKRPLFVEALDLYNQAMDKFWGIIDCSSFVVMRREGILDSLTADRHFSQAGFHCLLPTTRPGT